MKKTAIILLLLLSNIQLWAQAAATKYDAATITTTATKWLPMPSKGNWNMLYLSDSTFLVNALVMKRVKADYYVATFGLAQESKSVEECNTLLNKRIDEFVASLNKIGIPKEYIEIDFTTQERTYEYSKVSNTLIEETLSGFELKKNVLVRYNDHTLLDKLLIVASKQGIFDLVKVDYMIQQPEKVYDELFNVATEVIAQKKARYAKLTGASISPKAQIYSEGFSYVEPGERYERYTAFSSNAWENYYDSHISKKLARKMETYYYSALKAAGFDRVLNQELLEPSVQFIMELQIKCEISK